MEECRLRARYASLPHLPHRCACRSRERSWPPRHTRTPLTRTPHRRGTPRPLHGNDFLDVLRRKRRLECRSVRQCREGRCRRHGGDHWPLSPPFQAGDTRVLQTSDQLVLGATRSRTWDNTAVGSNGLVMYAEAPALIPALRSSSIAL